MKTEKHQKSRPYEKTQIHKRARINGEVLIHDQSRLYIAPLDNVSVGGFYVQRLNHFKVGHTVHVVVKSPLFQVSVQAKGVVVRVEKDLGTAVEFTALSTKARDVIETVVFENKMEGLLKIA